MYFFHQMGQNTTPGTVAKQGEVLHGEPGWWAGCGVRQGLEREWTSG